MESGLVRCLAQGSPHEHDRSDTYFRCSFYAAPPLSPFLPSLGLCRMGSRNDRKMSVRVQASGQKVLRPESLRKRKDAPGLCKTLFPSCVPARRRRPPRISALGGPLISLAQPSSSRLPAPASRSPAGSGITGNLGSNPALSLLLPAGHRLAPRGAANGLVREDEEGDPARKTAE